MAVLAIEKSALPLWDGDGVQGAGQPRDRRGHWIGLPGPSGVARAIIRQVGRSHHLIVEDKNRNQTVHSKHRSAKSANEAMAGLIKEDVAAYKKSKASIARVKRRPDVAAARAEHAAGVPSHAGIGLADVSVPKGGRSPSGRKPALASRRVEESTVSPLPNPGTPTIDQRNKATAHARQTMPKNESDYAGLVTRLLGKGMVQEPRRRGAIHDKYGISPKRQVEIEREMYDHMFPSKSPNAKKSPNLAGGAPATTQQLNEMRRLGARKGTPEAEPTDASKPSRVFKINKGPDRGKWARVSWNGHSEVISDKEAQKEVSQSKVSWTRRMLNIGAQRKRKQEKYRAEQIAIRDKLDDDAKALKEFKIAQASKWAEGEGLDPEDSYWHAFFWNDPSLLRSHGDEQSSHSMTVGLSAIMEQHHMDPELLEGILALPDIGAHEMRGHKPERNPKAKKGDPGFVEASPEARAVSPAHEAANRDRQITHDRRIKSAYARYKQKHPKSKMSLAEFTDSYYNSKMRIPGGSTRGISKRSLNPFWDGDGLQGVGQPRGYHGRWVRLPGRHAFSKVGVWEHDDGSFGVYHDRDKLLGTYKTARAAEKVAAKIVEEDRGGAPSRPSRRGNPWDAIKFKPLQGRPHKPLDKKGKPLAQTDYTPEQAAYLRNTGKTKITNRRLAELHRDRSLATQQEKDLLLSAVAQKHIDGEQPVRIWVKRRNHFGPRPRYSVMSDLAKEIANDEHRKGGVRGEGGQIIRHVGEDAALERKKVNAKNVATGRNKAESMAFRQDLLDNFGNGSSATCVICGSKSRKVTLATVSPERIKPGGQHQSYGGTYEKGNVAPSHYSCNVAGATAAQHDPEAYFLANLRRMREIYGDDNPGVREIIKKHRAFMKRKGLL